MTTDLKKLLLGKSRLIAFTCLVLVLSACSAGKDNPSSLPDDGYLHLSFVKTGTKADINPDGSGSFAEGDRVGLFIDNGVETSYRELVYSGGEWLPRLRRDEFGTGRLTLSAHYPAFADGNETVDFKVNGDQNGNGMSESDLLYARTSLDEGKYYADFSFTHIMHRLVIELVRPSGDISVQVRSKTSGKVNLIEGTVAVSSDDFQWIRPSADASGTLHAVIIPQSAGPYRNGEGLLKIMADGKEIVYNAPEQLEDGKPLEEFGSGKETTVRLDIKKGDESEWANRTMWVYGINEPAEGEWKRLFETINYTLYLCWDKKYGWYDINKRNPSNLPGGIRDGMMCWAASASNLLHWWMDRNKEYIDRYIEQGKYKGPDPAFNEANARTEDKQESQIFQMFLDSFMNEAGNIDEGVNWFIHGIRPPTNIMKDPVNNAGYFKDVFPEGTRLATNIAGMGKETFNDAVKEALSNRKALGINVGTVKQSHAVTIWGAEFDENGDVIYIYLADNNDRNQFVFWGYGCMKKKIVYVKMPEGGTMVAYKKGDIGEPENSYTPINRLYTLETGSEYFERYFNRGE